MTYKEFKKEIKELGLSCRIYDSMVEVVFERNNEVMAIIFTIRQYNGAIYFFPTFNKTKSNKLAHVCWELIRTPLDERGKPSDL